MSRFGFVINLDSCMDHRGCMTGCKKYKNTPMGVYDVECFTNVGGVFPERKGYFIPIPCQHCDNPSCRTACPLDNIVKDARGIVSIINDDRCITCESKACIEACPYGAIDEDKTTGMVYKCDMCKELLDQGEKPACIAGCLTSSWFYGDLDDTESTVSQIIENWEGYVHQLKPESGNGPNVYYLLSKVPWNDMNSLYTQNWHDR